MHIETMSSSARLLASSCRSRRSLSLSACCRRARKRRGAARGRRASRSQRHLGKWQRNRLRAAEDARRVRLRARLRRAPAAAPPQARRGRPAVAPEPAAIQAGVCREGCGSCRAPSRGRSRAALHGARRAADRSPRTRSCRGRTRCLFLYDDVSGNFFRIVPTDGRKHRTDTEPTYLGDAVGRWEGDTLVVETVNFNGETWLTDDGAFQTPNARVVERLKRTADTLEWTATVHDPSVLTAPWELRPRIARPDRSRADRGAAVHRPRSRPHRRRLAPPESALTR